jgi:hypothetical protein
MRGGKTPYELYTGERPQRRRLESRLGLVQPDGRTEAEKLAEWEANEAEARHQLREERAGMVSDYDESRPASAKHFAVGDLVLMSPGASLDKYGKTLAGAWRHRGVFRVHDVFDGGRSASLEVSGQIRHAKVSTRLLRRYVPPSDLPPVPGDVLQWANLQRFAPSEAPTGQKQFSTFDTRTRRRLEQEAVQAGQGNG